MLDRIVEVFCEVDDFCQAFVPQWEASLLGTGGPAPRGPQPGLSPSEIITLLLVLHSSGFKHLKSFYHGFAEPLATFPACPAMSTSSDSSALAPAHQMWCFFHIHEAPVIVVLAHFGARSDGTLEVSA